MPQKININTFIEEFNQTRLLRHLNTAEVTLLLEKSLVVDVVEGEQLIHEGDEATSLFFILDGALVTTRTGIQGEEIFIRLLGRGECCMDAVIFMEEKSPIGVKAIGHSSVLKIPSKSIKILSEKSTTFSNNLVKMLAHFYKESMLQIDNVTIKDSKSRVGYYLLRAYLAGEQNTNHFVLKFKKTVIANYLGMKPETFSRMLKEIQTKDHAVTIHGAEVTLTDSNSLCHFCDATTKNVCLNKVDKGCG